MQKRLLDVRECSEYLNVSVHLVYKMAETRQIPVTRIGRRLLFDLKRLDAWISENSCEPVDLNEEAKELIK